MSNKRLFPYHFQVVSSYLLDYGLKLTTVIVRAPGPARSAKRHLPFYERASVESGGRAVVVGAEGSNVDFYVDLVSVTI